MAKKLLVPELLILALLAAGCGGPAGGNEDADADATTDIHEDGVHEGITDPRTDDGASEGEIFPETAEDPRGDETAPTDVPAETSEAADAPGCDGCADPNVCCSGRCVSLQFDPDNCSACGTACPGERPYCNGGDCITTPCETTCIGTTTCCGQFCCELDEVCCGVNGPGPMAGPQCYPDVCPPDCPWCA